MADGVGDGRGLVALGWRVASGVTLCPDHRGDGLDPAEVSRVATAGIVAAVAGRGVLEWLDEAAGVKPLPSGVDLRKSLLGGRKA